MEDYQGNSNKQKAKQEKTEVKAVVTGKAEVRKKSLGKKFNETFGGGDAKSVWSYILLDVLIPAAKDMIVEATSQGVERMIFGEVRGGGRRNGRPGNGYVSYNRYSRPLGSDRQERPTMSRRGRATHDFGEIVLGTRAEAETVIDRLFDLVSQYNLATVADLYDLCDLEKNYMDDKWGWTDLSGAGATRVRNGYLIELPRPEPVD